MYSKVVYMEMQDIKNNGDDLKGMSKCPSLIEQLE
jgi:hypothetical protein